MNYESSRSLRGSSISIDAAELGNAPGTALVYPVADAGLVGLALGLWGNGIANRAEGPTGLVTWHMAPPPGRYEVWVRYAAAEERPVKLLLDGDPIAENALIETTGGWGPGHQRWRFQVCVELERKSHTLELAGGQFPHVSALALVCRADVDHRRDLSAPFPQVFVINADHRADRWQAIDAICKAANLSATRVPAIVESPGWRGCGRSHLKCVNLAKEKDLPWVLVLEDDATFTPESINRFRRLLPYLWENRGKWERFSGGPTFPPDPVVSVMNAEECLLYARGYTSHFNLIHAGAYDLILEWDPDRDQTIDGYFMSLETRFRTVFNSIATVPHISVQASSVSDVAPKEHGAVNDYSSYFLFSERKLSECLEADSGKS